MARARAALRLPRPNPTVTARLTLTKDSSARVAVLLVPLGPGLRAFALCHFLLSGTVYFATHLEDAVRRRSDRLQTQGTLAPDGAVAWDPNQAVLEEFGSTLDQMALWLDELAPGEYSVPWEAR